MSVQIDGHVDSLNIQGRSSAAVGAAFLQLEEAAKQRGLTVNCEKTKAMMQSRSRIGYGHALSVGCYDFEIVQEFKYLGSIITEDNNEMTEIHQLIAAANRAYFALKDVMKSANVHHKTKVSLHKTVIRTVLCYGSEAWTMTGGAEMALAAFEWKILRKIFGPVRPGDSAIMKNCTVCIDLQMSSPTLNSGDWNGLDMYTGRRVPDFQRNLWKGEY
jgi:hypothetical protein